MAGMDAAALEAYLHERIPLSRAMGVSALGVTPGQVILQAPLEPNINHRETVFGGSAAAVATLAAWSLLRVRLVVAGRDARIVIRRSTMDFERPIAAAFTATSVPIDEGVWQKLLAALERGRMARIAVGATLACQGEQVGLFAGEFAVLPPA
jgi:thioesterase domain-containing protein